MADTIGQLAALSVAGTATLTDVYTVPANKEASVNIRVTNSADIGTDIIIAHIKNDVAANVAAEDYIYGGVGSGIPTTKLIDNRAPIGINGILMSVGDTIAVSSSANAVSVQINGVEGDA
jgi:hypothetical protein